jgi:hypothetical protein
MGVQFLNTSADGLIEDLQIEDTFSTGIDAEGKRHMVRRCRVSRTGIGKAGGGNGIHVYGAGHRILDNDVTDTATASPDKPGAGIVLWNANGAIVAGNRIVNTTWASGYGITTVGTPNATPGANLLIFGNRISGAEMGIALAPGTTAKYSDTVTIGVATPYSGGTDAGNNN